MHRVSACGESYYENNVLNVNGKIVNGIEANSHSWPSIVKIIMTKNGGIGHCGGTLIDNRTVLSAAQ